MGVGVSNWSLARAVSSLGQLGVVSGTVIDTVFVRRLQDGDPGGHMRRAMAHFPIPEVAENALKQFFRPEGRPPGTPYKQLPMYQHIVDRGREQLAILAAFVEVHLAKEGHDGPVGVNLLTKVQLPNLALLYGAMLAGVDFVLMGAGIPREIPKVLDAFAEQRMVAIRLEVEDRQADTPEYFSLDPRVHWQGEPPPLKRPRFLPIISSHSLATVLVRKAEGRVDGFVIEGPTAGGHNAPPRGELKLNDRNEPVYGPRDEVDLGKIAELGLPFWIAGGTGSPERLREARAAGAQGIQVGTLFAFCEESGITAPLKKSVLEAVNKGDLDVVTDALASPTGFPFKVVQWPEDPAKDAGRKRVCDLGYLRVAYAMPNGRIGYRCSSEPEKEYVAKGGKLDETDGRKCLCNALLATIGLPQARKDGPDEPPLITSGDDLVKIGRFLQGRTAYRAQDVIEYLRG
ncbi:MAG: nitronate monooxygenase [Candidatus Eisenbacteria bacterium]|nr:nitronate monooxygenase [Candidatus Eisenbacteria bacterium]